MIRNYHYHKRFNVMKRLFILSAFILALVPATAQNFEAFVRSLDKAAEGKRSALVKQYLGKVTSTPIIEGKEKVHFVWFGKADTVRIIGELQTAWAIPQLMTRVRCGEEDFFYFSYTVPSNAFF